MPNPTSSDVHVSAPLTNMSVAFFQDEKNFIADKVFPMIPSTFQGDLYYKWSLDDMNREDVRERAPGTESAGGGFTLSTDSFFCKVYALHKDIAEEHRKNADNVLDLDASAVRYITQQLAIKRDRLWAASYFKTGVWTGADLDGVAGVPGANQFKRWDVAGSTPIDDVDLYRETVAEKTGYLPNTLVIHPAVFRALKNHADILDRIKYTSSDTITPDMLARLFEVERVLIGRSFYNTSKEGNATQTKSFVLGKHALLCYAAPSPGREEPSAGYTFGWTGMEGSGKFGMRMKTIPAPLINSERIEGDMAVDFKLVASDLGVFFESAVA